MSGGAEPVKLDADSTKIKQCRGRPDPNPARPARVQRVPAANPMKAPETPAARRFEEVCQRSVPPVYDGNVDADGPRAARRTALKRPPHKHIAY